MARTEEEIMLQRLGILDDVSVSDSDFDRESPEADADFQNIADERQRLDDWEFQLTRRESEANQREININGEEKRLKRWERELTKREADLKIREIEAAKDGSEYTLDEDGMDEYRRKKKAERLMKQREDAVNGSNEVHSVWSTGWNT